MTNGLALAPVAGYLSRVYQLRHFWTSLVRNDLVNRYRRSFLGIAWSLVRPIGMTVVLCTVFTALFNVPLAKYAPIVFMGTAIWQFLVESMIGGCACFIAGAPYIRQQRVPLIIFPLRVVLGSAFHTSIALGMAVLVTSYFCGLPTLPILLSILPGLVLLVFLALSLATLCGILHTYFPDTQHVLEIMLQIVYYLTPVMYSVDFFRQRRLTWVIQLNPFTSVIEIIRSPLCTGEFPGLFQCAVALAFLSATAVIAAVYMRRVERDLVFWI